jgi:glyoxylase-like metal-dependent hydrolase (beta-lactamase superfamily II)
MPLDRSLAEKLRQHQLRYASPVNLEGWIFANPATGKPYWPGRIQENWLVPAAEKVGLGRIGWHTFRHSHSSLLHALGVDLKVQQELLRHADIRTTMNIYTHAVPAALREANRDTTVSLAFDAPASFGKSIPLEVSKVTDKPIKMLVYSHSHKDHIGGSAAFKNIKDLKIVALEGVSDFLKEMNDPNRLLPNVTFKSEKTIKLGGKTVELTGHHYHSPEGDLFIYVPEAKFLMVIDSVTSGYAPFQGFDLSTNFHEYLKVFDEILAYKFDTFVGGHLTDIGTRQDVEITKEFTLDVYNTVKRIHNNMDPTTATAEAVKTVGTDNEFLLFKVFLDRVTNDSVKELKPRWINRLAGVDVWLESHVRTAIIYVRWDDKE